MTMHFHFLHQFSFKMHWIDSTIYYTLPIVKGCHVNPFSTYVLLLYLLKASKNQRWCRRNFRGYRSGTLVENGLIKKTLQTDSFKLLSIYVLLHNLIHT